MSLDAVFILHGLESGLAVFELFLAVHRDQETDDVRVFNLRKCLHRLVHAGACGNDVFDDHHVRLFGVLVTDKHSAFAVVLRFFAVVGEGEVLAIYVGKFHGGGGAQRNSLVGGTVEVLCLAVEVDHIG